jgi:hypothetical protein
MRRAEALTGPEPSVTFVTLLLSAESELLVRRAVASLREFGGPLASCPVLAFAPTSLPSTDVGRMAGVDVVALEVEPELARCPFGAKVTACAQAEALMPRGTESLVWLGPGCMVFNPPALFALGPDCDAAFRPVHIANVGSPRSGPLDEYWGHIYEIVGTQDGDGSVESLLDKQRLRPYYNTHCFAVNHALGLMAEWLELFRSLVANRTFQSGPGRDELHHIFLHQAVLSALVTRSIAPGRVRALPPGYSYPLHFHEKLPDTRQVRVMNDITVAAYEEDSDLAAVRVEEPLRSWLGLHRQTR